MTTSAIYWQLQPFAELGSLALHRIYAARQAVFIIEQNCVYQDADDFDPLSHHLCGWENENSSSLLAYLRILPPGSKYHEASLGRILTMTAKRGRGLGKSLMAQALKDAGHLYPGTANRISAQHYLEQFYQSFGFETVSDIYSEDGIPHVEMLRPAVAVTESS
jgi:ElaA protein